MLLSAVLLVVCFIHVNCDPLTEVSSVGPTTISLSEEVLQMILGCRSTSACPMGPSESAAAKRRRENFDMIDVDHLRSQLQKQSVDSGMIARILASVKQEPRFAYDHHQGNEARQGVTEDKCTQVTVNVPPQTVEGIDAQLQAVIGQNNHLLLEQVNTLFRLKLDTLQKNLEAFIVEHAAYSSPPTRSSGSSITPWPGVQSVASPDSNVASGSPDDVHDSPRVTSLLHPVYNSPRVPVVTSDVERVAGGPPDDVYNSPKVVSSVQDRPRRPHQGRLGGRPRISTMRRKQKRPITEREEIIPVSDIEHEIQLPDDVQVSEYSGQSEQEISRIEEEPQVGEEHVTKEEVKETLSEAEEEGRVLAEEEYIPVSSRSGRPSRVNLLNRSTGPEGTDVNPTNAGNRPIAGETPPPADEQPRHNLRSRGQRRKLLFERRERLRLHRRNRNNPTA